MDDTQGLAEGVEEGRKEAHLDGDGAVEFFLADVAGDVDVAEQAAHVNHGQWRRQGASLGQGRIDRGRELDARKDAENGQDDGDGGRIDHLLQAAGDGHGVFPVHRRRQVDAQGPEQELVDDREQGDVEHPLFRKDGGDDGDAHEADVAEHSTGPIDVIFIAFQAEEACQKQAEQV